VFKLCAKSDFGLFGREYCANLEENPNEKKREKIIDYAVFDIPLMSIRPFE